MLSKKVATLLGGFAIAATLATGNNANATENDRYITPDWKPGVGSDVTQEEINTFRTCLINVVTQKMKEKYEAGETQLITLEELNSVLGIMSTDELAFTATISNKKESDACFDAAKLPRPEIN